MSMRIGRGRPFFKDLSGEACCIRERPILRSVIMVVEQPSARSDQDLIKIKL